MNSTHRNARTRNTRITTALAAAAVVGLMLSGCADTASSGPSLVTTKSSTQLLAGEAVSRLSAVIDSSGQTFEDLSESCADEAQDPDGLQRLWRSSATVVVKRGVTTTADSIVKNLTKTFAEQGWVARTSADKEATELSNGKSQSTLRFTSTAGADGAGGTLVIEARGACVTTDGPESDEVLALENRTR